MAENCKGLLLIIDYEKEFYSETKPNYKAFDENCPDYWTMKYQDRFNLMRQFLDKNRFSILDIGCGRARALSYYQMQGADVFGIEPSIQACEDAKKQLGNYVVQGYYPKTKPSQEFDVINIEQVLSHAPNYQEILCESYDNLKDDGIIVIEEPNDNNLLQQILEAEGHGKYWEVPDHCNYFDFETMENVVRNFGYEVIYKTCTWPMEMFALMGEDYITPRKDKEDKDYDNIGKQCHMKRFMFLSKLPYNIRLKIKENFAKLGLGRDLVLFLRKGN